MISITRFIAIILTSLSAVYSAIGLQSGGSKHIQTTDLFTPFLIASHDAKQAEQIVRLGRGTVNDATFSDSSLVFAGSLGLWIYDISNLNSEPLLFSGLGEPISSVAYSPDGQMLALAGQDGIVRLWSVGSHAEPTTIIQTLVAAHPQPEEYITSLAFSPDGTILAIGRGDLNLNGGGNVLLWDVATGTTRDILRDLNNSLVEQVAFSSDGTYLAASSFGSWGGIASTIHVWRLETRQQQATLEIPDILVTVLSFIPYSNTLVFCADDGSIRGWEARDGKEASLLGQNAQFAAGIAFDPTASTLITANSGTVNFWDINTGTKQSSFEGYSNGISVVDLGPDNTMIATGNSHGVVALWNVEKAQEITTLSQDNGATSDIAFSPDGHLLAWASQDGPQIWDISAGTVPSALPIHGSPYSRTIAFSPDGSRLFSKTVDGVLQTLNINSGEISTMSVHNGAASISAFSSDGTWLVSALNEDEIQLWNQKTGIVYLTWPDQIEWFEDFTFSPDGSRLVATGSDERVYTWSIRSGELIIVPYGISEGIWSVCYSPDGLWLALGKADGTIHLWSLKSGTKALVLEGHTDAVTDMVFSAHSDILVSGSADGTVRIWSLR